jgi:hypothetical protein
MKITGRRTRAVFERYNITDQSDARGGSDGTRVPCQGAQRDIGTNNVTKTRKDKLTGNAKAFIFFGTDERT